MTSAISPKNGILEIKLYECGKSHLAGVENVLKLSSNENPFGPSDRAKEAVARSTHELHDIGGRGGRLRPPGPRCHAHARLAGVRRAVGPQLHPGSGRRKSTAAFRAASSPGPARP